MKPWLLRGLGLALVHTVVRVLLGAALVQWPLQGSLMRWTGFVIVVLAAFVWAGIDGIRDRRANPDPDDGTDLTMRWLAAGAVTGLIGGAATWLIDIVTSIPVGVKSLFFELTSGAAFTVLLVFLPATAAVALGRFFVGREQRGTKEVAPEPEPALMGAGGAADPTWRDDDAPTEIFPAVGTDSDRTDR
ncbi:B-4DMT family transporter [Rhodococcus yananensis]|uniref:B-4DMT family transporter n=1 Tax=Rhodococcus yananensis TaxID=2879464 RepID=UPI003EBBB680